MREGWHKPITSWLSLVCEPKNTRIHMRVLKIYLCHVDLAITMLHYIHARALGREYLFYTYTHPHTHTRKHSHTDSHRQKQTQAYCWNLNFFFSRYNIS